MAGPDARRIMPSRTRSSARTGGDGRGSTGAGSGTRRRRSTRRRITVLCMLIIVPLVAVAGVIGAGRGGSTGTTSGTGAVAAPAGSDLMTAACGQIANLAQAATNNTATPASMLSDMQQAAQYANAAAQTDPAWQAMAGDIGTLNTMVQTNSGDQAAFTSQLDTVSQQCTAVAAGQGSPPPANG
jgi:hypothetical protein